jgi:hypothetical protein
MLKCDNLGNFGQKYVIRFDDSKGIYFYNEKEKVIVDEFKPNYNRKYGYYVVLKAILLRFPIEEKEAIYNIQENIITSLYYSIEECHLVGDDLYYIACLEEKNRKRNYLKALFKFPDELIIGPFNEIYLHNKFIRGDCEYLIYKKIRKYELFHYPTKEVLLKANFITPAFYPDSYFYVNVVKDKIKFGIFHATKIENIELSPSLFKIFEKEFILIATHFTGLSSLFLKYNINFRYSHSGFPWKCPSCNKYWYLYIFNDNTSENFCIECDLEKLYPFLI